LFFYSFQEMQIYKKTAGNNYAKRFFTKMLQFFEVYHFEFMYQIVVSLGLL
jgi:hypothetical protein